MRRHPQLYKRSLRIARMEHRRGTGKDDLPVRRLHDAPHVRSSGYTMVFLGTLVFLAVLLLVLGLAVQGDSRTTLSTYMPLALSSTSVFCDSIKRANTTNEIQQQLQDHIVNGTTTTPFQIRGTHSANTTANTTATARSSRNSSRSGPAAAALSLKGQLGNVTAAVEEAKCVPGAVCACPDTNDFAWFPGPGSAAGIPTILHQSAKDRNQLKPEWQICQKSWLTHHPNWTYFVWEDADHLALVKSHFPWFLEVYEAFPHFIMRVDAVRYMYMFLYGGMYADMDVECLRSVEPLLQGQQLVLARMGPDHDFGDSIPNAWFASVPGHPFWWQLLQQIQEDGLRAKNWNIPASEWPRAEWLTGPEALKRAWDVVAKKAAGQPVFDRLTQGHCAQVLPHHYIFPYSWWKEQSELQPAACHDVRSGHNKNRTECVMHFPEAHAITYWSHSWE